MGQTNKCIFQLNAFGCADYCYAVHMPLCDVVLSDVVVGGPRYLHVTHAIIPNCQIVCAENLEIGTGVTDRCASILGDIF